MNPTFTKEDGSRIKTVSHANLYYHTKDRPLLVRFKDKTGCSKYGPWAIFEVDGDPGDDYFYGPAKKGEDHEPWWPFLEAQIQANAGKWILVTAQYDGDVPILAMEDADGQRTPPTQQATPAPPQPLWPTPSPRAQEAVQDSLSGTASPLQSDEELFKRCAILAGNVVNAFGEAHSRVMSDIDQRIATTLFIEARKNR